MRQEEERTKEEVEVKGVDEDIDWVVAEDGGEIEEDIEEERHDEKSFVAPCAASLIEEN